MRSPLIDVVVIGYRSEAFLPRLLKDLETQSLLPHRLHYRDNTGNPQSLSACWNDLAAEGTAPYLAVLNPDVALPPGWDYGLLKALVTTDAGVVHPVPGPDSYGGEAPGAARLGEAAVAARQASLEILDVDVVGYQRLLFYAPLMRRMTWERLGGVDERLRFWRQDSDFLTRLRRHLGLLYALVPGVPVWHAGQGSTRLAMERGELDLGYEVSLSDQLWGEILSGARSPWHYLSPEGKADVRRDPRYARMGREKMVVHVIPRPP